MMKLKRVVAMLGVTLTLVGCSTGNEGVTEESSSVETPQDESLLVETTPVAEGAEDTTPEETQESTATVSEQTSTEVVPAGYTYIETDGGSQSGHRDSMVVTNIGFGDREYYAYTNEHGQLVRVTAEEIILQDDDTEPVKSNGRYYNDEAKVPGVESDLLDEGHVIADSLGGVSNAYNITPQESTLNRHGDQAYMEDAIRDAGGATDFEAIITYPDTTTQVPSHYQYTYTVRGNTVTDSFDNINPDEYNKSLGLTESTEEKTAPTQPSGSVTDGDVTSVDTNGNGKVTIKEAKDAGISLPIDSSHWLFQYMDDRDGDGLVGE